MPCSTSLFASEVAGEDEQGHRTTNKMSGGGGAASLRWALLLIYAAFFLITGAEEDVHATPLQPHGVSLLLHRVLRWREQLRSSGEKGLKLDAPTVTAAVLCLASAAISSAGGIGGGALFVPVLHLLAGLGLKAATSFSAFMVTGGAMSNVLYSVCFKGYIDYDIALLLQPCMLLGVTLGVICNVVFPEWLVALLFVMLLAWSTFKTCRSGVVRWAGESKAMRERFCALESAEGGVGPKDAGGRKGAREPLLGVDAAMAQSTRPSWKKMATLVAIWMSFFLLQSLRGGKDGKGMIEMEKCGAAYWIITFSQAPLALLFTAHLLYGQSGGAFHDHNKDRGDLKGEFPAETGHGSSPKIIFPAAALLSGVLGGLFGIGGGLLMSPVLLQIGVPPQTTAATSSFMVLFSSSMSSVQYLMLGMEGVKTAVGLAAGCFVASLVGLIVVQRAVSRLGRASLIVFTVSTVMLLSMVSMACFGAVDVWRDYVDGKYMGFKLPC